MADADGLSSDVAFGAAGSATAVVAQVITSALGLSPEAAAVVSIFAGTIPGTIRVGFKRRAERRSQEAARGMAEVPVDPSAIVDTENTQEVFVSMFNDLMDAVDDGAAPALGHLAMSYAKWNLPPDRFFRAFGRVVRELDHAELVELTAILTECIRRIYAHEASAADAIILRPDFRDPLGHRLEFKGRGELAGWSLLFTSSNGSRLLTLLKQHGLAFEPTNEAGTWGAQPILVGIWQGQAARALLHLTLDRSDHPAPSSKSA